MSLRASKTEDNTTSEVAPSSAATAVARVIVVAWTVTIATTET